MSLHAQLLLGIDSNFIDKSLFNKEIDYNDMIFRHCLLFFR